MLVLGSTEIVIASAAPKIYGVSSYQVLLRSESSTRERDCPPLIYVIVEFSEAYHLKLLGMAHKSIKSTEITNATLPISIASMEVLNPYFEALFSFSFYQALYIKIFVS